MNGGGWIVVAALLGIFFGFRWGMKHERKRLETLMHNRIKHGIALAMVGKFVPVDYAKEEQPSDGRKH